MNKKEKPKNSAEIAEGENEPEIEESQIPFNPILVGIISTGDGKDIEVHDVEKTTVLEQKGQEEFPRIHVSRLNSSHLTKEEDKLRQEKKQQGQSDSEEEDDENGEVASEDDLDDLDDADKASTTSSSETKSEKTDVTNTPPATIPNKPDQPAKPGWFGKGRRKRARC